MACARSATCSLLKMLETWLRVEDFALAVGEFGEGERRGPGPGCAAEVAEEVHQALRDCRPEDGFAARAVRRTGEVQPQQCAGRQEQGKRDKQDGNSGAVEGLHSSHYKLRRTERNPTDLPLIQTFGVCETPKVCK